MHLFYLLSFRCFFHARSLYLLLFTRCFHVVNEFYQPHHWVVKQAATRTLREEFQLSFPDYTKWLLNTSNIWEDITDSVLMFTGLGGVIWFWVSMCKLAIAIDGCDRSQMTHSTAITGNATTVWGWAHGLGRSKPPNLPLCVYLLWLLILRRGPLARFSLQLQIFLKRTVMMMRGLFQQYYWPA